MAQHVVDAHGDKVLADGIMFIHKLRDQQLCADAVRTGYEHRVVIAGRYLNRTSKTSEIAEHIRIIRIFNEFFD